MRRARLSLANTSLVLGLLSVASIAENLFRVIDRMRANAVSLGVWPSYAQLVTLGDIETLMLHVGWLVAIPTLTELAIRIMRQLDGKHAVDSQGLPEPLIALVAWLRAPVFEVD